MEKIGININASKNIFRAAPKNVESNQTNPFGVSFKGNVLTPETMPEFTKLMKQADRDFNKRQK